MAQLSLLYVLDTKITYKICPQKQQYIASLSNLLTYMLSTITSYLQKYCDTSHTRSGVDKRNLKTGVHQIKISLLLQKHYNFSTLCAIIPHTKNLLKGQVKPCFFLEKLRRKHSCCEQRSVLHCEIHTDSIKCILQIQDLLKTTYLSLLVDLILHSYMSQ